MPIGLAPPIEQRVNAAQGDGIRNGDEFYRSLDATAEVAARRILPLVFDVVAVHTWSMSIMTCSVIPCGSPSRGSVAGSKWPRRS